MWHGQLSPRFKFNKLKSFSGVEIDQNHVDKRILGGKGFAVGRLKRHNFCPASVYPNTSLDKISISSAFELHFNHRKHIPPIRHPDVQVAKGVDCHWSTGAVLRGD